MSHRVLVVDDDADQRALLRHAFARTGLFDVVGEAAAVDEAAGRARECFPDVILLDLMLAGGDGLEVLPALREVCPDARIVALSGLPREDFEFAARAGGAVGYIEKDISPLSLPDALLAVAGVLDAVSEAMDRASATLEPHPTSPSRARRFVAEVLRRWRCEELLQTVQLAVSELVTNAVLHAGSSVDVSVSLREEDIRVDVRDRGAGTPKVEPPTEDHHSGRGLRIVGALATAWGVREGPGWKSVWFEVPRPDVADRAPDDAGSSP
jgi:CheY-like chemotaxis protein